MDQCTSEIPAAVIDLFSILLKGKQYLFPSFNFENWPADLTVGVAASGIWEEGSDFIKSLFGGNKDDMKSLVDYSQKNGFDARLVVEAARIVGVEEMHNVVSSGAGIWYQFNYNKAPINAFSYIIKNETDKPIPGQIKFDIVNEETGFTEISFWTHGFTIEKLAAINNTVQVDLAKLPSSGKKKVLISSKPENLTVRTNELIVLGLSPTI